jgi:LacI family transcriptional regulator
MKKAIPCLVEAMSKTFRVALLIDTSTSWGNRLIEGISYFARERGNWLLHIEPRGRYERLHVPQGWDGDGIIARINRQQLADEINATDLPTVNVSWSSFEGPQLVRCSVSELESGQMAAEYFLSIGFRQFAYCGPLYRPNYQDRFAEAYCERLATEGHDCQVYPAPHGEQRTIAWNEQLISLVNWLQQLPTQTGLLCWSAARGRQLTEACQYAGICVPDEVAVLGGEHDELMSRISSPPLSTVDQPAEQIGLEAARLLGHLMEGGKPAEEPRMFSPTRVIVRHSTDILAVDDEVVRMALQLIHEQAHDGVNVAQIVAQLMIARRALEQRFIRYIGRTPAAEIRRVRIETAKRLLVETELSMSEVARMSGFSEQDLFSRTFRRSLGLTPTQFRSLHHGSH